MTRVVVVLYALGGLVLLAAVDVARWLRRWAP